MFKIQTGNNKEMKVVFHHFNPAPDDDEARSEQVYGTQCFIVLADKPNDPHVAMGETLLHPLDYNSYNKEKGRKMALARALEDFGLSREYRAEYWKAYFGAKEEARQRARKEKTNDTN